MPAPYEIIEPSLEVRIKRARESVAVAKRQEEAAATEGMRLYWQKAGKACQEKLERLEEIENG